MLIELLGKYHTDLDLTEEDFTILLSSQVFVLERMKYKPLIMAIIGLSQKIGKPAIELIKSINETISDFDSYKKEIELDENKIIKDYLDSFNNKTGSLNEMDDISQLICDLINRIKEKRGIATLNSVLIIDDLDRLDPEHTFRLFNVFCAHFDSITETNKFGFDKVMFVCDIENIKNTFHYRYGQEGDFNGYIDKFYSTEIFDFDNRRLITHSLFMTPFRG